MHATAFAPPIVDNDRTHESMENNVGWVFLEVFLALGVVLFRMWLACVIPLCLLAQRLFTVSTAFSAATVVSVHAATHPGGYRRPDDETWFEVVVSITPHASTGGVVAPGAGFV